MVAVRAPVVAVLRPMEVGDVEAVCAIEAATFSTPWKADTFRSLLARDTVEAWVLAGDDGELAGYAILICVHEQAELANLAVVPARRGVGLGARLLDHVLEVARARGVESLFLEVRRSNDRARALYRGRGFLELAVRSDYYERPKEDALVLVKRLGPESAPSTGTPLGGGP